MKHARNTHETLSTRLLPVALRGLAGLAVALFVGTVTVADPGDIDNEADLSPFNGTPQGVALDEDGNLYIAVPDLHLVYKRDAVTDELTVFAGVQVGPGENPVGGFSGDGVATEELLNAPSAVAVGRDNDVFIADTLNHRIRRVNAFGFMGTVAGTGVPGFDGDGPASGVQLSLPSGLAVDPTRSNLYIADLGNERIRKVGIAQGFSLETVVGSGERGFAGDGGPASDAELRDATGVTVSLAGDLYIADVGNEVVRRVTAGANQTIDATDIIDTVAGNGTAGEIGDGGPATDARLNSPTRAAVDGAGNLFIADSFNKRIRRVDSGTGTITTFAGTGETCLGGVCGDGGPAVAALFHDPVDVILNQGGDLFVADTVNQRVRKIEGLFDDAIIHTVAGNGNTFLVSFSGEGGPATSASLDAPEAAVVDDDGNLLIADSGSNRIRKVDAMTGKITTIAGDGIGGGSGDGGPAVDARVNRPADLLVDADGDIFIADTLSNKVRKIDAVTGEITTVAGSGNFGFSGDGGPALDARLASPSGIDFDLDGNLYIADASNNRIRRVDAVTGTITTFAGSSFSGPIGDGGPATDARLALPLGVAVDDAGNVFIADTNFLRVRRVDAVSRIITTVAGDGTFGSSGDGGPASAAQVSFPAKVALDADANLFIADKDNHRIRRVDAGTGIITTVAGNGDNTSSGDGGPAVNAGIGFPRDIALSPDGALIITDTNNRIRRVGGLASIGTTTTTTTTTTMPSCPSPSGVCGQPVNSGQALPLVSDCLYILRAAVGIEPCCLCPCDTNGSGDITASDALDCLFRATGLPGGNACTTCP